MTDDLKVQDGYVVSLEYTLHVDGELIDESHADEPLEFIQGQGMIISGLENALYGMTVDESKSVLISPEDGYGELDEEAFIEVEREEFPAEIPLEIGLELEVRNQEGETMTARIDDVKDDKVRLDFNHPLAGKALSFDVKVLSMRAATAEELDHGHVHGEDGEDGEDGDDDEYEDYDEDDNEEIES
jgi:FKBP-type peptidyl-prolyl cis-trans isomerase SlyD